MLIYFLFTVLVSSQIVCVGNSPKCKHLFTCSEPKFAYAKINNCLADNYFILVVPLNNNCSYFSVCNWLNYNRTDNKKYSSYLEDENHNKLNNTSYDAFNLGTIFALQMVNFFAMDTAVYIKIFQNNAIFG